MDIYFWIEKLPPAMSSKIPFLRINLRAMAQATEMEARVKTAMVFTSGVEDVEMTKTWGHFGNPIMVFQVELTRASDMKRFLEQLRKSGILNRVMEQLEQRLDHDCILHFRLDKQMAYAGELAIADGRDVIDVGMKVAAYPARRDIALRELRSWFVEL